MKWANVPSKASSKYMRFYTDIIDLYFKYNAAGYMYFRAVVVNPTYQDAHPIFNNSDPEEGFYKLYYQLIYHTLRPEHRYHIRPAYRDVSKKVKELDATARLEELRSSLNHAINRDNNYSLDVLPVLSIAHRFAKDRRLIQLADIFMGAVGYHWNGLHMQEDANEGKTYLASYIASKLGREDLRFFTPPYDRQFNIFHFIPGKKVKAP